MESNIPRQVSSEIASELAAAQPAKEKSHFTQLFIVLALLGILFLGGTYVLIISQKTTTPAPVAVKNTVVENQKDFSDMENALQETDSEDIEKEFTQVDQEMKNL